MNSVFRGLYNKQRHSLLDKLWSLGRRAKHQGSIRMDVVQKRKALLHFQDKDRVLMFDRQAKSTLYKWGPWVAGGQLLMWINFADFYWRYTMDKNEETGEMAPASVWKRASIAAIAVAAGVTIGASLLHYINRSVARFSVIKGGRLVELETYRISGRGTKRRVYPIEKMFSRDTLFTGKGPAGVAKDGSPQYSIYSPESKYAFILNRSGGFRNPKMFDVLFHRAAVKTEPTK